MALDSMEGCNEVIFELKSRFSFLTLTKSSLALFFTLHFFLLLENQFVSGKILSLSSM